MTSLSRGDIHSSHLTFPSNKCLSETHSGLFSTITITAAIMLSNFSIIALLAATTFASALPAGSQSSVSRRQDDWNLWFVRLFTMRFYLFFFHGPSSVQYI
jgi:hypothetical protein